MSGKRRLSKDQARKAKLAKRSRKAEHAAPKPYEGTKYQKEQWAPYVFATELGIYEGIVVSRGKLTNVHVKEALCRLIEDLRSGLPPRLLEYEQEEPLTFVKGREVEFLESNIRRHWGGIFDGLKPVPASDLVGILRTLLYSIEAHAWHSGPSRGYVAFLKDFMENDASVTVRVKSQDDESLPLDAETIELGRV